MLKPEKTLRSIAIDPYSAGRLLEATSGRNFGADKANFNFFFRLLLYWNGIGYDWVRIGNDSRILFNFETVNFL
jgi:hypothetical protein